MSSSRTRIGCLSFLFVVKQIEIHPPFRFLHNFFYATEIRHRTNPLWRTLRQFANVTPE